MKIKNILKEKENEISIINELHDEEIKKLNKTILNLQEQIKELYQISNQKIIIRQNDSTSNYRLLNKIKEYERKIQKLHKENFDLKKEIEKTYSKCDELTLLNENKEKVIEKLSLDFQDTINKLNNEKQNENILMQNQIDKNEYNNKIFFLTNENQKLYKKIENYEQILQKFNNDVNEANKLFSGKNQFFKKKVSEYKHKIITLKTKINELYEEIDSLKRNTK
jgi:predicted RNase H-like nuclease (RuvC/YqgF family)